MSTTNAPAGACSAERDELAEQVRALEARVLELRRERDAARAALLTQRRLVQRRMRPWGAVDA